MRALRLGQTPCRSLEVLDYARRDVINNKGRVRDYNDLDIPIDLLPGAIALMAEVRGALPLQGLHGALAVILTSRLLRTTLSCTVCAVFTTHRARCSSM